MPRSLSEISEIESYFQNVILRAEHHAGNVDEILLVLAGGVLWRKDSQVLKAKVHNDDIKNVLWVYINKTRYAFSYNHDDHVIEMRKKSIRGPVIASFNNQTPVSFIKDFFGKL